MKLEDYSKYYIQGSDHYLIPKDVFTELFNEMINWKEENQKLKDRDLIIAAELTKLQDENKQLKEKNTQLRIEISAREEEYKRLEDNWNKVKEYIKQEPTSDFYNDKLPFEVIMVKIITKMQELERGVSDEIK